MLSSSFFARFPAPAAGAATSRRLVLLAGLLLLAALALMPLDVAAARFVAENGLPGDVRRVLVWSEAFAHGLGVALIGIACACLDPTRRRYWPRVLVTAYAAGLAANVVKLLVVRLRPADYLAAGHTASGCWAFCDTFRGTLPWLTPDAWSELSGRALQSFPSGHAATATGLACALWQVYPRGRALFALLAALSGLQRLEAMAHFPSDVLCGAAVGCLTAAAFAAKPACGSLLNRGAAIV